MKKKFNSKNIGDYLVKYWYFIVFIFVFGFYLWKKKKSEPISKDQTANDVLTAGGIGGVVQQDRYKAYAAQLAQKLGTAYPIWDPRNWVENDEQIFELLKTITTPEFTIIKKLYFSTYAKGRDLSTDLANMLDDKYYRLLRVK